MAAERRHLVIVARRPAYGVGKRRLAREAGDLVALRFQRHTLASLLRRLGGDRRWTTWIAVSPDRPTAWTSPVRALPQGSGDLGRRLTRVFRKLPPGAAVMIGADAPGVTRRDIADAFARVGPNEAVFGPAPDGGYWLIGLSRRTRRLPFHGVRWSTEDALADTLANLARRRVALLRELEDVDDLPSYQRAVAEGLRRRP